MIVDDVVQQGAGLVLPPGLPLRLHHRAAVAHLGGVLGREPEVGHLLSLQLQRLVPVGAARDVHVHLEVEQLLVGVGDQVLVDPVPERPFPGQGEGSLQVARGGDLHLQRAVQVEDVVEDVVLVPDDGDGPQHQAVGHHAPVVPEPVVVVAVRGGGVVSPKRDAGVPLEDADGAAVASRRAGVGEVEGVDEVSRGRAVHAGQQLVG